MNGPTGLRFLRPYLYHDIAPVKPAAYARFFANTTPWRPRAAVRKTLYAAKVRHFMEAWEASGHYEARLEKLEKADALHYPRMRKLPMRISVKTFNEKYASLKEDETREETVTLCGRILSIRSYGKLMFVDILENGHVTQVMFLYHPLASGVAFRVFRAHLGLLQRGDFISVTGMPNRNGRGSLIVASKTTPEILTPSLNPLPTKLENPETRIRHRHIDLLANRATADTLRLRSHIIQSIRDFLINDEFLEVQTPIITDKAGGAFARPFTTVATEFSQKQLALRIAPELWLKRLVIGGMDRVFEIGPAFRNEGLDATHNPEFTTCEFYKAYATLDDLISMTETLISRLVEQAIELRSSSLQMLPELDTAPYEVPFKRLEFIPTIEAGLGERLPDLFADDATEKLLALFNKHNITPPSSATLPRLLDALSSLYIEPQCKNPTFIINHPACLAPLAKSYTDQITNQFVSARAELFIESKEIANMYEEENSPFEQKKKFIEQLKYRDDENTTTVDENYIGALELGLPPTGGWGAGIDRLVMLLSRSSRISDVLPFGNLRNVVNLGQELVTGEKERATGEKDGATGEKTRATGESESNGNVNGGENEVKSDLRV
ncbi:lysyl-tRNA synthetase protein [Rutstroemia sp. NJR-2017a BBW]|nr:lysyl-tRNA synthetase protein [Rutstroemia sp. NJR-2017a BBW]